MAKSPTLCGRFCAIALWLQLTWVASTNSFYLFCPPCDTMPACSPLPQHCNEESIYYDECGCCPLCAKAYGQRCGGWLNAAGDCGPGLRCAYRLGGIYGVNREGRCEPELCSQLPCGYRETCSVVDLFPSPAFQELEARCDCPIYLCNDKENPVCGNNGISYPSVCKLRQFECHNTIFIGIRHEGTCPPPTPAPPTIPPKTTTPPDDLFPLFPPDDTEELESVGGCSYMGQHYGYDEMVQAHSKDPCRYLSCTSNGILSEVFVPGCRSGPPEIDYGEQRFAVLGRWSVWSEWNECVGPTCYNSTHNRTRTCTNPAPRNEGRGCTGISTYTERCIPERCEANFTCVYSEWSDWSDCSVSCGSGTQVRTRTLLQDILDLSLCTLQEMRECNLDPCVTGRCRPRRVTKHLVDENGCPTVFAHKVKFCGGSCSMDGSSCVAVESTLKRINYAVECPGEGHYRDSIFFTPTECMCEGGASSGDSDDVLPASS